MTRARRALVALAAAAAPACGAPLMKLPPGPGAPAPDAPAALAEATSACRGVTTLTAEIGVSGSAAGHRARGTLSAGVAAPASARLEAVAPFGQPLFILVTTGGDATLLLPRDNRVLEHGKPAAVLEAIAGVPLDGADLRRVLTGCAAASNAAGAGHALGDDWRLVPGPAGDVYLHREPHTAPWHVVATVHGGSDPSVAWRAEYSEFANGLPRAIRLASSRKDRFDLRLKLSQVDLNVPLGAEVFRVRIPPNADPISIDELRQSGPLGK